MTTTANIGRDMTLSVQDSALSPRLITTDTVDIGGITITKDQLESGGYSEDKRYTHGRGDSPLTLTMNWTTTPDVGTFVIFEPLFRLQTAFEVIIELGENAPPTTGDRVFTGTYKVFDFGVPNPLGELRQIVAVLMLAGPLPVWSLKV